MWTRAPHPGEPCRDLQNHRVGRVVHHMHTKDVVILRDRIGEWQAPLEETEPASETEIDDGE